MSLTRTAPTGRRAITTVATSALELLVVGCLIGLGVGTVDLYLIQAGLTHVQSGP